MKTIAFIDTETQTKSKKVLDCGAIDNAGNQLHSSSVDELIQFINTKEFVCGHNIIHQI